MKKQTKVKFSNRPGVGGGRGGQNWGQILNVIFRNLHPYRLWNGQLFCLLLGQQKLDPGVPNPDPVQRGDPMKAWFWVVLNPKINGTSR